jgi:two-component SAPR family response regulator
MSGLGFYSYGKSKDLRTGLNLTPDKLLPVKDEFELSFSFNLRSNESQYFGYVFRLISGNKNIDLIFNYDGINSTYFTFVQGQKLLLKIKTEFSELCSDWTDFRFVFDIKNNKIDIILPDTSLSVDGLALRKGDKAGLSFGLCNYENYRTTDVPAMNIRDIKITEDSRIIHHWPLDELNGNSAKDIKGNSPASAVQPLWLKSDHYDWKELLALESESNLLVAFDREKEDLIIIGPNEILKYSVRNNLETRFIPKNKNSNLLPHRQAIYENQTDLLYCLDIDKPSVSVFDFNSLTWSKDLEAGLKESDFEHYNKYFSASERAVYFFGGYGHHRYKNLVQRYDLHTDKMEVLKTGGDFFSPRYLSASGYLNDTIYILGGFGSTTGEQILNPHGFNDLMTFSLKTRIFNRKFEIPSPDEDFAFSNSMIIIPEERAFYVLGFPIFKYNGYLQLIKGSLNTPEITFMGSQIPYEFLDIVSYSDLFYCKQNNTLLGVTLQNEEGKSRIKIYSLGFPPDMNREGRDLNRSGIPLSIIISGLLALAAIMVVTLIYLRKRSNQGLKKIIQEKSSPSDNFNSNLKGEACHVHFFGDFQAINGSGVDITRKFTPLLKELFLLIWFNSIKNDIGISNEKIVEILWHGFSDSSAQNNKAVNIAKLRAILAEDFCCELSHKTTGYWKIDYKNRHIVNDYYEFIKITSGRTELLKPDILKLIELSHKGPFLSNLKYKWLDEFKVAVSNEMIDRLVKYEKILVIKDQPEHVIQVADALLNFDNVNEEAMENKCKALILLGRHSVAKEVYDQFSSEYRSLYNEDYSKSFTTIAHPDDL